MYTLLHLAALTVTVLALERLLPSVQVKSVGVGARRGGRVQLAELLPGVVHPALLFVPAILTLGLLFLVLPFVVNTVMLWLTDKLIRSFEIKSMGEPAALGGRDHGRERPSWPLRAAVIVADRQARADPLDLRRKACNLCRMRTAPAHRTPSVAPRPWSPPSPATACKRRAARSERPRRRRAISSQVVVEVDESVITVGDVQERINKQSPFVRARYTTPEKKKEFLDNLIRFEVMADEAEKRGYDKDPEVVRVMKQQMISKFLQKDFESKLKVEDVPDADVEKYYKDHPDEFNQKDEVRVSEIVVKDKAKADKALAEAKAQPKGTATGADQKGFRDLVTKYSEDEESKARGGDLTFFDKDSTMYPKPVVEAAFKLAEVGDVVAARQDGQGLGGPQAHAEAARLQPAPGRGQAPDPAATVPRHAHEGAGHLHRRPQEEDEDRVPRGEPGQGRHRERRRGRGPAAPTACRAWPGVPGAGAPRRRARRRARRFRRASREDAAARLAALALARGSSREHGCCVAWAAGGRADARLVEKVAAVVGNNIILASEVEEKAGPLLAEASRIPDPRASAARARRRCGARCSIG